jgi:hypothetical protein
MKQQSDGISRSRKPRTNGKIKQMIVSQSRVRLEDMRNKPGLLSYDIETRQNLF